VFSLRDNNATYYTQSGIQTPTLTRFNYSQWGNVIQNLTPSTTYTFTVTPYATNNSSNFFSGDAFTVTTSTILAVPGTPFSSAETATTINVSWSTNGNPSTTLYAVYNRTLNQYHAANGSLSATPVFFVTSSWNGSAVGLSPVTFYSFAIIMRNENSTQNATSTAALLVTRAADGSIYSSGGGPVQSFVTPTTSPVNTAWYFGTTPPSTTNGNPTSPTNTLPTTTLPDSTLTGFRLPDGTLITPGMVFGAQQPTTNNSGNNSNTSVTLFKGKNLSSNILFSGFSTTANPLKVRSTLKFKYSYTNPSLSRTYRVERVLLNPLGKVVTRSVTSRSLKTGAVVSFTPSQYFSPTLTSGLYTVRIRITSPNGVTVYDENTFDLNVKK
jgi:hypothetical protein